MSEVNGTNQHKSSRRRTRILLGVTGSVAGVKAPEIALRLIQEHDHDVKVVLTKGGRHFWDQSKNYNSAIWNQFEARLAEESKLANESRLVVIDSSDEWREWKSLGDPVMHIDLRNWADCILVAPLSAHSLSKFRHGLCDDVLSSVVRAWNFEKPMLLAPAMNTAMWDHVLTREQLTTVQGFAANAMASSKNHTVEDVVVVIDPMVKSLACGEVGKGGLAPVEEILAALQNTLQKFAIPNENETIET